jgi:glyoxylase-like metal-dependent hydrolase (beta-lactamase superfamily II)/8-oxo-dGTP pyrophosphatase MutT (NUDIX family)
VVLLRDSPNRLETLLTVRPRHLRFMGGASVFPGGAVSPADLDERWEQASALDGATAAEMLGVDDPRAALGAFVCALREAFEEVGYLDASGPATNLTPSDAGEPQRFLDRCLEEGVVLATDRLVPAGRWVTPLGAPVRFDALFFLTHARTEWDLTLDPAEVAGAAWLSPAAALAELAAGTRLMAPPTVEMLQRLDAFESPAAAIAGLRDRGLRGAGDVISVRLSPLVHVVLAPNPSFMTGPGTNTYVVGSQPTIVIDPAVPDRHYIDSILEAAGEVEAILVTHRHSDHVGGIAVLAERTSAPVRAWGHEPAGGVNVRPLADGAGVTAGTVTLTALHTPGHASDHLCYLLEGTASLFAGDNVLGEGTAVIAPPDGNMSDYLATLRRLESLQLDRIYPGHFRPLDGGTAVIRGYLAHRAARESAILDALRRGPSTVEEIVSRVYTDVAPNLHPIARFSVLAHLEMCEEEGRVLRDDDRWILSKAT